MNANELLKEVFLTNYRSYLKSFLSENYYKMILGLLDENPFNVYSIFQYFKFWNFSTIEISNALIDENFFYYLNKFSNINYSGKVIVPGVQILDDQIFDLIQIPRNKNYNIKEEDKNGFERSI